MSYLMSILKPQIIFFCIGVGVEYRYETFVNEEFNDNKNMKCFYTYIHRPQLHAVVYFHGLHLTIK